MKTKIMGILNITPDSFSDGGKFRGNASGESFKPDMDIILKTAEQMIKDGASVLDIGGESTRPDGQSVSTEEEIERVVPVIEIIRKNFDVELSVDTYKAATAIEAVKAGASIVNDIGFMRLDEAMGETVAKLGVKYILMHNIFEKEMDKSVVNPKMIGKTVGSYVNPTQEESNVDESYVNQFFKELDEGVNRALSCGITAENLILDPGIGFNKTYEQNLWIMGKMRELCKLDYPILLGVSRKSVIGNTLNLPVSERLEGTMATSVMAAIAGVKYLRVHDVKENARAVAMAEKLMESGF